MNVYRIVYAIISTFILSCLLTVTPVLAMPSEGSTSINVAIVAGTNLLIQIVIGAVVIAGAMTAKKGQLKTHGYIMTFTVALNAVMIVTVMGPSIMSIISKGLGMFSQSQDASVIVHEVLGGAAEILGAILVFKKFKKVRLWMRITFTLWMASLIFGIFTYLLFYVF
jgi:uncharacterized membrane protein YozB (DUF420 family)